MKKRYLIMFIFLILFNVKGVYAEDYWFDVDKDSGQTLFASLCPNDNAYGCKVKCRDGREGTDNQDLIFCGGYDNLKSFRPSVDFSNANKVQDYLFSMSGCSNYKNCYDYVLKKYCDNNDEKLCKDLIEHSDDAKNNGVDVNDAGECVQSFRLAYDVAEYVRFSIKITGNSLLIILDNDPNGTVTFRKWPNADSDEGFEGVIYGAENMIHFYGLDSNYDEFTRKYINEYNKNKKCPKPIACSLKDSKSRDSNIKNSYYYQWYMEFASECDKEKYKGSYSQILGTGGETADSSDMIDTEKINILGAKIGNFDCDYLFGGTGGSKIKELLKSLVNIIKILIPIILICLGIMDFSKAVFSGSEEDMKKAQKKFIKRIIIAICVFLIPAILKVLLTIANGVWGDMFSTDFCGVLDIFFR